MRLASFLILFFLSLAARAGGNTTEVAGEMGFYYPIINLDSSLKIKSHDHTVVQEDGLIHVRVQLPELGERFFKRHHLHLNIPYFSNGYRHNYFVEISKPEDNLITLSIPSEQPVGTPVYFYDGVRKRVKTTFERVVTPIVQFLIVSKVLGWVGHAPDGTSSRPYIDFKNGGFFEGIEGYALLDSSVRAGSDLSEHLEIYYQMDPAGSSATVVVLFASGAFLMRNVPMNPAKFDALGMQNSFSYSVMAGGIINTVDQRVITPKFSEYYFPSNGSVRNFRSKLFSQAVRGPGLSLALGSLDKISPVKGVSPAQFLTVKKLMMKAAAAQQDFNKMVGQGLGGTEGQAALEWGMNIATLGISGVDGPPGSLKQMFIDQFEQKLGVRSSQQLSDGIDKMFMNSVMKDQPDWVQGIKVTIQDLLVGGLLAFTSAQSEIAFKERAMLSSRYGKGIGMLYAFKDFGSCIIEPAGACSADYMYDYVAKWLPFLEPYFRKDYMVEIDHGISKTRPDEEGAKPSQPAHWIHDEL